MMYAETDSKLTQVEQEQQRSEHRAPRDTTANGRLKRPRRRRSSVSDGRDKSEANQARTSGSHTSPASTRPEHHGPPYRRWQRDRVGKAINIIIIIIIITIIIIIIFIIIICYYYNYYYLLLLLLLLLLILLLLLFVVFVYIFDISHHLHYNS